MCPLPREPVEEVVLVLRRHSPAGRFETCHMQMHQFAHVQRFKL